MKTATKTELKNIADGKEKSFLCINGAAIAELKKNQSAWKPALDSFIAEPDTEKLTAFLGTVADVHKQLRSKVITSYSRNKYGCKNPSDCGVKFSPHNAPEGKKCEYSILTGNVKNCKFANVCGMIADSSLRHSRGFQHVLKLALAINSQD